MEVMIRVTELRKILNEKYEWDVDLYQVDNDIVIENGGHVLCEVEIPHPVWFQMTPSAHDEFVKVVVEKIDNTLETQKKLTP